MKKIENIKNSLGGLSKQIFIIISVMVIYSMLAIFQIAVVDYTKIDLSFFMFIVILINIFLVIQVFKFGFKYFKGESLLDRSMSIFFGLLCYLCLLSQMALIFFYYYYYYDCYGVIPREIFPELRNGNADLMYEVRILLNYVFPNFYKYPTATGIMVVVQFYIGKFTDLFILAFIVEKIKKR